MSVDQKKNVSNSLNLFIGGGDIPKLKRTTKQFVELSYWLLWEPVSYLIFNVLCALYICILIWLQFNSCWKQFLQRLHFLLYSLVLGWDWYRGVTRSRYNRCFTTPINLSCVLTFKNCNIDLVVGSIVRQLENIYIYMYLYHMY